MLKIRDKQLDALSVKDPAKLIDFIVESLRRDSPEFVADQHPNMLQEMVRNGVQRAQTHGFEAPEDLLTFVTVMFQVAPNFDEHEILRSVLDDPNIPTEKRFDVLCDPRFDLAWKEASDRYDDDAWFPEVE